MSSTAAIVNRSSSSSVTGDSPAAAIPATASPGAVEGREEGQHRRAAAAARAGARSVASVVIASVPWLPTNRWVSE